jgi:hypothetical protein
MLELLLLPYWKCFSCRTGNASLAALELLLLRRMNASPATVALSHLPLEMTEPGHIRSG